MRMMAHIPENVEWYLAELILEISVSGDERNVVHKNLMLIKASSPDEAYAKAIQLGKQEEDVYENPSHRRVRTVFRGLSKLNVIYEPLEDGAELLFEEIVGVPEQDVRGWVLPKASLAVFRPITSKSGPDYSAKE